MSAPAGYSTVNATTFDIVGNPSYNGRYTVYTPTNVGALQSSTYTNGNTEILVNEIIGPPQSENHSFSTGTVTNISTFSITIHGEAPLIVPPAVKVLNRPLDFIGRQGSPWAESFTQNFVKLAQNFASEGAPSEPFLGQTWYDTNANLLKFFTPSGWTTIASGVSGSNNTVRVSQTTPSTTWEVPHNLSLASPFVCLYQVFVDVGSGSYKHMLPSDVEFTDANNLTITFSVPQVGVVLLRA